MPNDDPRIEPLGIPTELMDMTEDPIGRELDAGKFIGAKIALAAIKRDSAGVPCAHFFSDNGAVMKVTLGLVARPDRIGMAVMILFGDFEGTLPRRAPGTSGPLSQLEGHTLKQVITDQDGVTFFLDSGHVTF